MDFNIAKIFSCDLIVQETLQVSDLNYRINTTDYAHFKGNNFRKSPVNAATDSQIYVCHYDKNKQRLQDWEI